MGFEPFKSELIKEELDFIYIDGKHDYYSVLKDIIESEKIVKPNGIIGGHDYFHKNHPRSDDYGVRDAVDDYYSDSLIHTGGQCDWWVINKK